MNNEISIEERELATNIYHLRTEKLYTEAISECEKGIDKFNDNNFFYKIKGDILFEIKDYKNAIECYVAYLGLIYQSPELFTNFAKFFSKIKTVYTVDKEIYRKIQQISRNELCSNVVRNGILKIICDYWPLSNSLVEMANRVNDNFTRECVDNAFEIIGSEEACEKISFLARLNINNCNEKNQFVVKTIIKAMESVQMYEEASHWLLFILELYKDNVLVRSLFRICRLRNDYSDAIEYMQKHDLFETQDFNLWYELVLFYNSQEDEENRNKILKKIDDTYPNSMPISNTLFKFYVEYNMLDNARAIEQRIDHLRTSKKAKEYEKSVQENRDLMWKRLNDLIEEQEHNRQLLAITELIKGFSHELGQPITNIRYAIQLYDMKNEKAGIDVGVSQRILLDGILKQTSRVGKLLGRFAPIVSSKNVKTRFNVYDEIKTIFEELEIRLNSAGIKYNISGDRGVMLYGETIQFSQIFYNLIINSIYAIDKKKRDGIIEVEIEKTEQILFIRFWDNGIGIPREIQRKIFDPFYSTKRKEVEEGGEGLGLYIVWNILKMFKGKIFVDSEYADGAKFVMQIVMEEEESV